MVATYNNIATNLTKQIRNDVYNFYSERQCHDSDFLVRLEIYSLGNLKPKIFSTRRKNLQVILVLRSFIKICLIQSPMIYLISDIRRSHALCPNAIFHDIRGYW